MQNYLIKVEAEWVQQHCGVEPQHGAMVPQHGTSAHQQHMLTKETPNHGIAAADGTHIFGNTAASTQLPNIDLVKHVSGMRAALSVFLSGPGGQGCDMNYLAMLYQPCCLVLPALHVAYAQG